MFEFIALFIFFYWLSSLFNKDRKKRSWRKPSLDQELKELIQVEDNSTGIALSVKQYLLDVLDDDNKFLTFSTYWITTHNNPFS